MEIDKDFTGFKQWKEGSRQHLIGEPGETKQDAIAFMHAHLKYFEIDEQFGFDAARIQQDGNNFIVRIHKFGIDPSRTQSRFRLKPPLDTDDN